MKIHKLFAMAVLISVLSTATAWAQATRWYIYDGPGAGVILNGVGNFINDANWEAEGHVGSGPECDCAMHYHGVLFGDEDPAEDGCGWGCIVQLPATTGEARTAFVNAVNNNTGTNTALREKINNMINLADGAIASKCNSLFEGITGAIASEIDGAAFNGQLAEQQINNVLKPLLDYLVLGLDEIAPPFEPQEPPKPCKVALKFRHGSSGQTKLFEAKRKVNADVGEVVTFDAEGCPDGGTYEWEYRFKGAEKNAAPSRTGVAFTSRRFSVLAEKATSVTVTVIYHCPDGKTVKDTVTVNIQ